MLHLPRWSVRRWVALGAALAVVVAGLVVVWLVRDRDRTRLEHALESVPASSERFRLDRLDRGAGRGRHEGRRGLLRRGGHHLPGAGLRPGPDRDHLARRLRAGHADHPRLLPREPGLGACSPRAPRARWSRWASPTGTT
ncbi:hypothetical protein G5V59_21475 [Nocardioides sp. W3-2-3]|uniref:hypothetical protein n=1 Tax=Nocardioides convexus TaxID=2712224 RepID=UPI00241894E6|nr:hypothetical protein [Nocardioides convexus]NHA01501.1 hypothetical protein [Nocardioides convexus]